MAQAFETTLPTRFRDADPAGFLFFGRVFELAHDAYEEFVQHLGYTWQEWFSDPHFLIPLRHAEANYFTPIWPGEPIQVHIDVLQLRETSFQLRFRFFQRGQLTSEATTVHIYLNAQTREKSKLPDGIRAKLDEFLANQESSASLALDHKKGGTYK